MPPTKGVTRSVSNWKSGVAGATGRYTEGVKATTDWQQKAIEGDNAYKQRIQDAIAKDLRLKGVQKTSNAEWQNAAATKGSQRWGPGVNAAEADYSKGIQGVLSVIESVPEHKKTGDIETDVRETTIKIAKALRAAKEEGRL